jgi:hypothetical protein
LQARAEELASLQWRARPGTVTVVHAAHDTQHDSSAFGE